jgi:hypothetical protein
MCDHSRYEDQYLDKGNSWLVTRICIVCKKVLKIWTEPKGDDEY